MAKKKSGQKWRRLSLATNGRISTVRFSDMDLKDLGNLLYAILEEIPHAPHVMKLVLDKYNKDNESQKPGG